MAEGSTQIAAESSSDTKSVTEGAATLLVTDQLAAQPGATAGFYNPRMRLNRELCLAEIDAALEKWPTGRTVGVDFVVARDCCGACTSSRKPLTSIDSRGKWVHED